MYEYYYTAVTNYWIVVSLQCQPVTVVMRAVTEGKVEERMNVHRPFIELHYVPTQRDIRLLHLFLSSLSLSFGSIRCLHLNCRDFVIFKHGHLTLNSEVMSVEYSRAIKLCIYVCVCICEWDLMSESSSLCTEYMLWDVLMLARLAAAGRCLM
jgi:hypothetical protein